ncbi:MAG: hypothetical protein ACFFD7_03510 [Candidatus Thorarchaeota archaeon]
MLGKKQVQFSVLLLVIFLVSIPFISNLKNDNVVLEKGKQPTPAFEVPQSTPWINNPTMESPIEPGWFWKNGTEGDNSDVEATSTPNQADIRILGESKTFAGLGGVPNSSNSLGWLEFQNGDFLLPDTSVINGSGCYVSHFLDESTGGGQVFNYPSVHWKNNVSITDDMSDHNITSASIELVFNASVDANVDTPNDPIDGINIDRFAIGDDVTFYVELSDLENSYSFRIGEFKSEYLGQQASGYPTILNITDSELNYIEEQDIIAALNAVLEYDNHNFTVILGIDIYCEDNLGVGGGDQDKWNELIIKSFNLTFTYEKKIDPFTTISWNQVGNQLSGANIQITEALFNFKYKIDKIWPTSAPLSEIRFLINDKIYSEETIKLSSATTNFQEAKVGGFDVTGFVDKDVNISVSIEVILKDTLYLDEVITISVDEVYLNISYIITYPDKETNMQILLNGVNKTSNPVLEVIKDTMLNITVMYTNGTGDHIKGAIIQVSGDRLLENLTENVSLEHYSININVTDYLLMGVNILTIEASFPDHETKQLNPRITVRKIQTLISSLSGSNSINIESGGIATLEIVINNTDYGGIVKGAFVTYTWSGGEGILEDYNDDGIYVAVLPNVPTGTYPIFISAFAGDGYTVDSVQITLNVISSPGPDYSLLIYILIGAIIGLGTFITLYQTHFKYPPMVRKIRKLRKKIGKGKKAKPIEITERKKIIDANLSKNIGFLRKETIPSEDIKNSKTKIGELK